MTCFNPFVSALKLIISCNSGYTIHKLGPVEDVCVVKHSFLQGYHNKLKQTRKLEVNAGIQIETLNNIGKGF